MSSKGAGTVMGEQDQQGGLVPKLRFPEFSGAWHPTELTPHLKEHSERVPSTTSIPIYSSTRSGLKPQNEYFDGANLANDGEYRIVPKGYFTFRHMSDDGTFKFNVNNTSSAVAVSKEYPVFTAIGLSTGFLLYILNNSADFSRFALMQKKGGTRTRLYLSTLRTWTPLLPSFGEQQKIADCLSSIDTLIAAEADKLEALKDHKKGLMQQLFPAPGETSPRLRFPEFQGGPDWEERPLGEIASYQNGKAYEPHIVEEGRYIVVNARFISTEGGVKKWSNNPLLIAEPDDILMVLSDLPNGRALAKCYRVREGNKYAVNQRVARLTPHAVRSDFLFAVLNRHPYLLGFNDGLNQTHLSKDNVLTCPILLPVHEEEQMAIADCLTSVDGLIAAQVDRLNALNAHKQGLMQQLFPVADQVQA